MKVVLDTNVLASGIFWGGTPLKILNLWRKQKIEVLVSESILDEYLRTIQRIAQSIKRPELFRHWSMVIPSMVNLVSVKKSFRLCRDPKDDQFVDCAIAGRVWYLISGDNDLLVLEKVMRVRIVTPGHFLREISHR